MNYKKVADKSSYPYTTIEATAVRWHDWYPDYIEGLCGRCKYHFLIHHKFGTSGIYDCKCGKRNTYSIKKEEDD